MSDRFLKLSEANALQGPQGEGVAAGGAPGQTLKKVDSADYNTQWADNTFSELIGQPTDNTQLAAALNSKVDKIIGYQLSQENYTTTEKNKLANLSEHYKGTYTTTAALSAANATANAGDYAFIDAGTGANSQMYIWDTNDSAWVLSTGNGIIPDATESNSGIIALATLAQAIARTDDTRAMTALKTISLILDEKKNVSYQINPVSVNEVSILMENAGQVNSILIAGASNAKLRLSSGSYPTGSQTFPFAYNAGDVVYITYTYSDLTQASCNIKLKCRDN